MADVYPDVPIRGDLEGQQTLLSIDKARRLLGYDPQHSWRDHVPETTSGNSPTG
jgi:UDP-glucose 4-epimerase